VDTLDYPEALDQTDYEEALKVTMDKEYKKCSRLTEKTLAKIFFPPQMSIMVEQGAITMQQSEYLKY